MSTTTALVLCLIAFASGYGLGSNGKLDLVLALARKDDEIDALNTEADELSALLVTKSISPDNVPTEGRAA